MKIKEINSLYLPNLKSLHSLKSLIIIDSKKEKYNLEHVYNSIELFVSMYNYTIVNKNKIPILTKENLIIS